MSDPNSADYNSGYGQARADVLLGLKEAMALVTGAIRSAEGRGEPDKVLELESRLLALRWARALTKATRRSDHE